MTYKVYQKLGLVLLFTSTMLIAQPIFAKSLLSDKVKDSLKKFKTFEAKQSQIRKTFRRVQGDSSESLTREVTNKKMQLLKSNARSLASFLKHQTYSAGDGNVYEFQQVCRTRLIQAQIALELLENYQEICKSISNPFLELAVKQIKDDLAQRTQHISQKVKRWDAKIDVEALKNLKVVLSCYVDAAAYIRTTMLEASNNLKKIQQILSVSIHPDNYDVFYNDLGIIATFMLKQRKGGTGNMFYWKRACKMLSNEALLCAQELEYVFSNLTKPDKNLALVVKHEIARLNKIGNKYQNKNPKSLEKIAEWWREATVEVWTGLQASGEILATIVEASK